MAATTLLIMTDFRIYEIEIDLLNVVPAPKIGFSRGINRHSRSRFALALWLLGVGKSAPSTPLATQRCAIVALLQNRHHMPLISNNIERVDARSRLERRRAGPVDFSIKSTKVQSFDDAITSAKRFQSPNSANRTNSETGARAPATTD
jgi:hypothetical protein